MPDIAFSSISFDCNLCQIWVLRGGHGVVLREDMIREPNLFIFATVLLVCANMVALECGKEIHEEIIKNGFQCNVFVGSSLVDMYAKCGKIEDAHNMFDKMPERNMVSWNSMITSMCHGREVQEQIIRSGFQFDVFIDTALVDMYGKCGSIEDARKVFDKVWRRKRVSWVWQVCHATV